MGRAERERERERKESTDSALQLLTLQLYVLTLHIPRLPHSPFVACSMKSGGRPGRIYHMMRAAADVLYCS